MNEALNVIEVDLLSAHGFQVNVERKLHQWDTGMKLQFTGVVLPAGTICQFDTKTTSYNQVVDSSGLCEIPNLAIGEDLRGDLLCHLKINTEDYGLVIYDVLVGVIRRVKPSNYIYSDNIQHIDEWISQQVALISSIVEGLQ